MGNTNWVCCQEHREVFEIFGRWNLEYIGERRREGDRDGPVRVAPGAGNAIMGAVFSYFLPDPETVVLSHRLARILDAFQSRHNGCELWYGSEADHSQCVLQARLWPSRAARMDCDEGRAAATEATNVVEAPVHTFTFNSDIGHDKGDVEFAIQMWDWVSGLLDRGFQPTEEERVSGFVMSPLGIRVRLSRLFVTDEMWSWREFRKSGRVFHESGTLNLVDEFEHAHRVP